MILLEVAASAATEDHAGRVKMEVNDLHDINKPPRARLSVLGKNPPVRGPSRHQSVVENRLQRGVAVAGVKQTNKTQMGNDH